MEEDLEQSDLKFTLPIAQNPQAVRLFRATVNTAVNLHGRRRELHQSRRVRSSPPPS